MTVVDLDAPGMTAQANIDLSEITDWPDSTDGRWSPIIVQEVVNGIVSDERERWAREETVMEEDANTPDNIAKNYVEEECIRLKNKMKVESGIGGIPSNSFAENSLTLSLALESKCCFICQDVLRDPKWCLYCFKYFCSTCIKKAIESPGQSCYGQVGRSAKCEIRNPQSVVSEFMDILKINCTSCKETIKYADFDKHILLCSGWCERCGLWQNARNHLCVDELKTYIEGIKKSYEAARIKHRYLEIKIEENNSQIEQLQREMEALRLEAGSSSNAGQRQNNRIISIPSTYGHNSSRNLTELAANDIFDRGTREQRTATLTGAIEIRFGQITRRISNIRSDTTWNTIRQRICEEFNVDARQHDLLDLQYRIRMGRRTVSGELFYPLHRLNLVPRVNLRQQQNFLWHSQ